MPDINGIPYVESTDLVSAYPAVSLALAQELDDQLAEKLPYSYGTATPSTTDSGFLWYDSNSTPPVPKYWNGSSFATLAPAPGLELITAETLSGVSSLSVNGCFTSDYQNYAMVIFLSAATSAQLRMKLRASSSDLSASLYLYNNQGLTDGGTEFNQNGAGSSAGYELGFTNGSHTYSAHLDIYAPQATQRANITGQAQCFNSAGGSFARLDIGGKYNAAATADGFSLLLSTGTMTGTVRVYGYKD